MKFIGAAAVIIFASALGFDMRRTLRLRADILGRLRDMCAAAAEMISYERTPPEQLIIRLSDSSTDWQLECIRLIKEGVPARKAALDALSASRDILPLHSEEIELLKRFFNQLGSSDAQGEISRIKGIEREFARYREDALEEYAAKGRLYASCGILAGIFAAILLL